MKYWSILKIWNKNRKAYEIKQNKTNEPGKWRTILKSFHYMDKKDKTMLSVSMFLAVAMGLVPPFNIFFFMTPLLGISIKAETPGNPYNITMSDEIPKFIMLGCFYIITGFLSIICGIIQIMASERASRNIMAKIKTAYLSKMLYQEVSWYDKSQEQYVGIVSQDLQKMTDLFDSKLINALEIVSFFFFGLIFAFIASWKIAILTFGVMSISFGVLSLILQASKTKGKESQTYITKSIKIVAEMLGHARTVAAYGGEYKEIERYESTLKMANKYTLKHTTLISAAKAFNYFQLCISYLVAYYFAFRLYLIDDFNPEYIAVILLGQIDATFHCSYMLNIISDLLMATDSAYKVMTFLDTDTRHGSSIEQDIVPNALKMDVLLRNVQFSYPTNLSTKVLNGLTLDIKQGKFTAVVGTSGVGKSTIISLISRLYDVTGGQILIGGVDIKKLNASWLRDQIGVVRQEPDFFDTSIEENIRYGKTTATLEEIIEAAKISYAHEFIKKLPLGYDTIVGERGIKLSGGQKLRIAIARAIIKKPKLLLLDEATSALDIRSEGIVQEALENAMQGRTTLVIAHRMCTVKKADIIYAVKGGRVIEKGSHKELMELKGYYYSLTQNQELDEKDKAVMLRSGSFTEEEFIEEALSLTHENMEVSGEGILKWLNKKNLKVIGLVLLALLFAIFTSSFLPTFYFIFSFLCRSFTYTKNEMSRIVLIDVGYLIGLGVLIFLSVILVGVISTIATQLWLEKLKKKAFEKLVSMEISWFDMRGNSPNECLEILTSSPMLIESVTGDKAAQVVIFILSFMFSVSYLSAVSPRITLINFPLLLIFKIINFLRMRSRNSEARAVSLKTRSTKIAIEYVQNVKTIQVLNCQKYILNQYKNMLECSKKEDIVSIAWYAVVYGFSKALVRLLLGIAFVFEANEIASGHVKGTSLIGLTAALGMVCLLVGPALVLTSQYPAAKQALRRLYRIACTNTALNSLTDQGIKPKISGNITFQDVTFSYPTRERIQVLNKLNLKIEAGKMVALVGDSGCGKSTIIALLERFYLNNKGKIMIDGININDINVRYLRRQMGLVPQEPVLFDMTIKENIIYGSDENITMDKIVEAAKTANIHNFIIKLPQGYDTPVGERGSKLSGGQKQRIAIARAVLRNPKILLLDEATSALDTEIEKAVQDALENASVGRTCIAIAHRLSTIRKADKIVVLQAGAVVEEGNHEELVARRGHYFNMLHR